MVFLLVKEGVLGRGQFVELSPSRRLLNDLLNHLLVICGCHLNVSKYGATIWAAT